MKSSFYVLHPHTHVKCLMRANLVINLSIEMILCVDCRMTMLLKIRDNR